MTKITDANITRHLPRSWVDRLFRVILEGSSTALWDAAAAIILDAFPEDILIVWETFNVSMFQRDRHGQIVLEQNAMAAQALKSPQLYNALNLSFEDVIRSFDDATLARANMAEQPLVAGLRPLHACTLDFLQRGQIHATLALYGRNTVETARLSLLERVRPILQACFGEVFQQQREITTANGLSGFLRELPVGLILVDWFGHTLAVNDEGYRQTVIWNEAPRRASLKDARERFAVSPDIRDGWDGLRSAWIDQLRTSDALPRPIVVFNRADPSLKATVSLVFDPARPTDTPCFMTRFSSIHTRAVDALFVPSPSQFTLLAALSPAERSVAVLLRDGLSNREIADKLGREVSTVKDHLTNIYAKTGIVGRSKFIKAIE